MQRELSVSCSARLHGADAAGELAFAKGAASRKTGTIDGTIAIHDDPYHSVWTQPRANVVVRAVGTKYSTRTGPDGFYRLLLPPGSYELELVPDDPGSSRRGTRTTSTSRPRSRPGAAPPATSSWCGTDASAAA